MRIFLFLLVKILGIRERIYINNTSSSNISLSTICSSGKNSNKSMKQMNDYRKLFT